MRGVDLTSLPLSPLEGFVFSRIDGSVSVAVLADLTNLGTEDVNQMVERLIELGAVEWAVESVSLPKATGRAATGTPTTPFEVPPSLRNYATSSGGRGRIRLPNPRPTTSRPEGVYTRKDTGEVHVDPQRRGSTTSPRASHTGSIFPPGELEEVGSEPPESPESLLSAELAAETEALERALAEAGTADTLPPGAPAAPISVPVIPSAAMPSETAPAEPPPAKEEELDLDLDRQRRINDLYYALDLLDHYQVLGVAREAPRKEIRTAYFALSKVFHPDTMFRKRLGGYKAKMESIFQRLTEAYEILGKKKLRIEYDEYLGIQDKTREVERVLAPEDEDEDDGERERLGRAAAQHEADVAAGRPPSQETEIPEELRAPPEAAPRAPEPVVDVPPARARMTEAGRERQRRLMAKKLRHATRGSTRRKRPATPSAPREPSDPKQVLRSLASTLKGAANHTGGLDSVRRYELRAERAERDGDLAAAAGHLGTAVMLAPDREDLADTLRRVNTELNQSLATSYETQATYEERHSKWSAAAVSWAKVFAGRPEDPHPARKSAEMLLRAKGDLHKAKELAQKAAELGPKEADNLLTLGKVYIAAGLDLNAKRVLERAATLDPEHEMVENLLRGLG